MTTASLRYVAFDQLHDGFGVLNDATPGVDIIVMVESEAILRAADWHPERVYFYRSSARHFAKRMEERGFTVHFLRAESTVVGLRAFKDRYPGVPLLATEQ